MKKAINIIVAILIFHLTSSAQKAKKVEYSGFFDSYYYRGPLNITLGGGTTGYIGDLGFMPGASFSPAFNLGASYMVWPKTYFGLDLNYLTLAGNKSDSSGKISFNTTLYEVVAYGRFNLIDKRILFKNDINKRPQRIRPYITLGIGAAYIDPKVTVTDTNFFKTYTAASSGSVVFVLPASLGFAFYINKRFSLLTDFGYRYTFTDALDGISKIDKADKDMYMTAMLKIQYTFHPFRKRRAKYVPPAEGSGGSGSSGKSDGSKNIAPPAKKDSTLNDPILPPGAPAPAKDSITAPGSGTDNIIAPPVTPPVEEKPKELTDEEKRKIQEEKEQAEWENSSKPKPAAQPADKKKTTAKPKPKPKPAEETGGW